MRTYEYRLYPNREQRRRLDACLDESCHIYNEMLEREKQHYQQAGTFLSKYDLTALFKGRGGPYVPASTVQTLADRLDKAWKAFLAHRDENWGFPRFKSANQWHSIQLRQLGIDFAPNGRMLKVPAKLGTAIKIKLHRSLTGTPKTCYLVKRADGQWYALLVCELPEAQDDLAHPADDRPAVGIDVGLKVFLTDSDGSTVENPRFFRIRQSALRRKQRRLCARRQGRRRRGKMARSAAQTHLKIERLRRDFHFKTAKRYAERYSTIVVEDLNIRGLARSTLAKSILDAAWGAFLRILTYKAARAGGDTPLGSQTGGFLEQRTYWHACVPTDVSRPFQDIDCGVVVAVYGQPTAARNPAILEREMLKIISAPGAGSGGVGRINFYHYTSSFCRFGV